MRALLNKTEKIREEILLKISGSKSETNRLLILKELFPAIHLENSSESDDSLVLQSALNEVGKNKLANINIGHAGTAMRFLTAYFSTLEGAEIELSGSERMHNRPIGVLVEALQKLGANISYLEKEGYPPLLIRGKFLDGGKVVVDAGISSQFLTALILIAPKLSRGLEIHLKNHLTSESYLRMTLDLLWELKIKTTFIDDVIRIFPKEDVGKISHVIESDWSSLSYYYSLLALLPKGEVSFKNFKEKSFQGDAVLQDLYKDLGVETCFDTDENKLILKKEKAELPERIDLNLISTPDIAQTIAVTCFGLGIECHLTGLHTLRIKETNRLEALRIELEKLGAKVEIGDDFLCLKSNSKIKSGIEIDTYQDHRMAMAFAPLIAKTSLVINDALVVTKSYPDFWEHLQKLGLDIQIRV